MSDNLRLLQVFIASPNDLADERRAIKAVADGLNLTFGKEGTQIQLLGWEDRLPGYGRPQEQINEDVDKADLFIGFLWRRWGSDPGNSQFTSGFEEEFKRALERREKSSAPEICLFFKDVDRQALDDPGDQLKRVLDFRQKIEQSKTILFQTFKDNTDWKEKTQNLLLGHLLKLLRTMMRSQGKEQPQAPPLTSAEEPKKETTEKKETTSDSTARSQVVRLWSDALEVIKDGELSAFLQAKSFEKLQVARLGLVVTSITNRDIEATMPGVHLANILFKNRKQIELTQIEWFLVFRANLVPDRGYRPAWYWVRKIKINLKVVLIYLVRNDSHVAVRKAALELAKRLELPLFESGRDQKSSIQILCEHDEPFIRKAALEYLAEKGSTSDLPVVEKLRADQDGDVRSQAEATRNAILLREDPTQFFENSILTSSWTSDDILETLQDFVAGIKTEVLIKALKHQDTKVQIFAAKELVTRGFADNGEVKKLRNTETSGEIQQVYFLKGIKAGQKFTPKEIRDGLKMGSFEFTLLFGRAQVNVNAVLHELFKLYTFEELTAIAESESDDAPIAYRILAEEHFAKFGDKVRADLKSDFARLKEKPETPAKSNLSFTQLSVLGQWSGKLNADIAAFELTALFALGANGNGSDRELVMPFIESKPDHVRIAAIIALRRVGVPQDQEILLQIAEQTDKNVALEAAKTALALAPGENGSANRMLKSNKPELLKLAICSMLKYDPQKVWPQIEDRLYDEDEKIRKLVCAYAIKKFSAYRLTKLLDNYLEKERYFYNVVFFLDRAIYSKSAFRKLFLEEIDDILK